MGLGKRSSQGDFIAAWIRPFPEQLELVRPVDIPCSANLRNAQDDRRDPINEDIWNEVDENIKNFHSMHRQLFKLSRPRFGQAGIKDNAQAASKTYVAATFKPSPLANV